MSKLRDWITPSIPDDIGEVFMDWHFPEIDKETKINRTWLLGGIIIMVALIIFAIFSNNYLFVVILFITTFIIVFGQFQKSRDINVVLAEDGIIFDKKFYPYKLLQSFWLIYEPPQAKFLYLSFKSNIRKPFPIPLEDANPLRVREVLLGYLTEDLAKEDEEFDEILSKLLKIR